MTDVITFTQPVFFEVGQRLILNGRLRMRWALKRKHRRVRAKLVPFIVHSGRCVVTGIDHSTGTITVGHV